MELQHQIRMKFGTSPNEPSQYQLHEIVNKTNELYNAKQSVTEDELRIIVSDSCPTTGSWIYKGLDTTDVVTLLTLILRETVEQNE
ncbi:hypothetical protein CGI23_24670 [Vibrio parahaemolyticus]|uniref:hypothetical protein n=1 Tax=Vibrio parahaemolyticus TaxID=670 RepID=UPI00112159E0|nr:hypothetical protein [Vibrio parahaemolyticus]TOK18066.1 hypothetical protein CGI23_24670 [Vibrio parahaemolyticus]